MQHHQVAARAVAALSCHAVRGDYACREASDEHGGDQCDGRACVSCHVNYQELACIADEEPAAVHAGEVAASLQRGFVSIQLCVLGVTFGFLLIASVASVQRDDVAAEGGGEFRGGENPFVGGKKKDFAANSARALFRKRKLSQYSVI